MMTVVKVLLLMLLMKSSESPVGGKYSVHKLSPMRCALEEFDSQVQHVLADKMLTTKETKDILHSFNDFQDVLSTRWRGVDLLFFGSVATGLGSKASDVDIFVRIPDYNTTADEYIVEETVQLLQKHPEKYSHINPVLNVTLPRVTFYDISKQRCIDLSFKSDDGVAHSDLVVYYLNLDKRYAALIAIIKLWCKAHKLTSQQMAKNYGIYLMVIFYLQQKKMSPSGFDIQANVPPRIVDGWNVNFEEMPYSTESDESLYELLGGFFKYYSEFNFQKYCVSPFVGRPIAKSDFKDLSNIPKELSLLKNKLESGETDIFQMETDMCVQSMYEHNINTVTRVKTEGFLKIINHFKIAVRMYNELPCNKFLTAILYKEEINKTRSHPRIKCV